MLRRMDSDNGSTFLSGGGQVAPVGSSALDQEKIMLGLTRDENFDSTRDQASLQNILVSKPGSIGTPFILASVKISKAFTTTPWTGKRAIFTI